MAVGERIPSKFDQWDYKPLRTRSFKARLYCLEAPHNTTLSVPSIHQSRFAFLLQVFKVQMRKEHADRNGVLACQGQEHVNTLSTDSLNGWRFITCRWQWAEELASVEAAYYNDRLLYKYLRHLWALCSGLIELGHIQSCNWVPSMKTVHSKNESVKLLL